MNSFYEIKACSCLGLYASSPYSVISSSYSDWTSEIVIQVRVPLRFSRHDVHRLAETLLHFLRRNAVAQGILTKGEGRLSTVDLFIKLGCLVKRLIIFNKKGADLNYLTQGGQLY
jgi:hypothetical protein